MGCGLPADLCIPEHWSALPGARTERAGFRADCPGCGQPRCLSVHAKGRYPSWNLFCQPRCDRDTVRAKLAELLPGCVSVRYSPRHAVDPERLVSVILDKSIPPNALRVALLQELGWKAAEIRSKLDLPKSTYYDTVRILGLHRRSA